MCACVFVSVAKGAACACTWPAALLKAQKLIEKEEKFEGWSQGFKRWRAKFWWGGRNSRVSEEEDKERSRGGGRKQAVVAFAVKRKVSTAKHKKKCPFPC